MASSERSRSVSIRGLGWRLQRPRVMSHEENWEAASIRRQQSNSGLAN
jgi:hypothetical protein